MQQTAIKILFSATVIVGSSFPQAALAADYTNSIGVEFVKVPAGSFVMGSRQPNCPADDPFTERNEHEDCMGKGPTSDEMPAHKVTISQDINMGKYEVTQAQWYAVMGNNPAKFKSDSVGEDSRNFPVEQVSWDNVQEFIRRLNVKEGRNYRLPTEAEWEYACRSGGKDEEYCGGNDPHALAWYDENSGERTHRVGTKKPNGLGLYDMSGNVREWCSDRYDPSYYAKSPASDPTGPSNPSNGSGRVLRGGGWNGFPWYLRAAVRNADLPGIASDGLGFRLVLPSSASSK